MSVEEEKPTWHIKEIPGKTFYVKSDFPELDSLLEDISLKEKHAREVHLLARQALESMTQESAIRFETELIIAEFVANAFKHGGILNNLSVAYLHDPERIHIVAVNPVVDERAPEVEEQMGAVVADEGNDSATHGRGLTMVDELSDEWGQKDIISRDGEPQVAMYAIVYVGSPENDSHEVSRVA